MSRILFSLLTVALLPAQPPGLTGAPQRPRPTNAFGAVVVGSDGSPRAYTRAELAAQAAAAEQSGGVPPTSGGSIATTNIPHAFGYASFGTAVGLSHLAISDALGVPEIYVGGSSLGFGANTYWYTLRFDAARRDYVQVHFSRPYPETICRLLVGDFDPRPGMEIVVVLTNGRILVHDQATKGLLRQFDTSMARLTSARLFDLDADGRADLLLCTQTSVQGYRADGTRIFVNGLAGGEDAVPGQMDADPGLEVATGDGSVIDLATNTIQLRWPQGFGIRLEAVDFDGDGMQELIAAWAWSFCWAYDIDLGLPKWSIPVTNTGAMDVADVDGDGRPELLLGDAQWGNIHAHDLTTQQELWAIRNPDHGTTDIAVFDVDGDGVREVLWGAGATSSGQDRLYIGNAATRTIEWENLQLDGPFIGPVHGDIDGDGVGEFVAVSSRSNSGYGAGRIVAIDEMTCLVEGISQQTANNLGWNGIHDIVLYDFDRDGDQEIVIAAATTYQGLLEVYDYDRSGRFTEIWSNNVLPDGKTFYSVAVADVDGDGTVEIVAGSATEHSGSDGVFVYVYDYATGNLKWRTEQLGTFWSAVLDIAITDIDNDGALEIVAVITTGEVYVFDGVTRQRETILSGGYRRVEVARVGNASALLLGTDTGGVDVVLFAQGGYRNVTTIATGSASPVDGLTFGPFLSLWTGTGRDFRAQLLGEAGAPFLVTNDYGPYIGNTGFSPTALRAAVGCNYAVLGW